MSKCRAGGGQEGAGPGLEFIFRVDAEALSPHSLRVQSLDHLVRLQPLLEQKETGGSQNRRRQANDHRGIRGCGDGTRTHKLRTQ